MKMPWWFWPVAIFTVISFIHLLIITPPIALLAGIVGAIIFSRRK